MSILTEKEKIDLKSRWFTNASKSSFSPINRLVREVEKATAEKIIGMIEGEAKTYIGIDLVFGDVPLKNIANKLREQMR